MSPIRFAPSKRSFKLAVVVAVSIAALSSACTRGEGTATTSGESGTAELCHPTLPTEPGFDAPGGRAANPTGTGPLAWHGTPELWTVLDVDGTYTERKSVWWSTNFPGGDHEERPEISVIATRLDQDALPIGSEGLGTNGFTDTDGWFMIANFPTILPSGCWEITGTYKGTSLTLVVDIP